MYGNWAKNKAGEIRSVSGVRELEPFWKNKRLRRCQGLHSPLRCRLSLERLPGTCALRRKGQPGTSNVRSLASGPGSATHWKRDLEQVTEPC